MTDIVELLSVYNFDEKENDRERKAAADEIERLRAENERLRKLPTVRINHLGKGKPLPHD